MLRLTSIALALASPALAQDVSAFPEPLKADIVILGEIHDNGLHHQGQAELIARINPQAVVFEMLSPEQAAEVNADPRADISGLGDRIGWDAAGWPDFALYQPIFEAMGQSPAVGAAAPREAVRGAFADGAFGAFGPAGARFGLDTPLPEDQRIRREDQQFTAHCEAMPRDMMGGMVEAQRYRDARFAQATLEALETYGSPVVLITGNGHARKDWAVPSMIGLAAPEVTVFTVGFVEAPATEDDPRFDMTVITQAADRPDPCDAFETQ